MDAENKPLILVVDDVSGNLRLIGDILDKQEYDVAIASSGLQALTIANAKIPDLILLDIQMPGMSGFDVCKQLKENETTVDIPVIFLTAKSDTDSIVRGFDVGATDYITKPFSARELTARVKNHLELKFARQRLTVLNATKDQLLSIIGHDLRGHIGGIKSVFELFQIDRTLFERKPEFPNLLYNSINSVYTLLENLLSWVRIQNSELKFEPCEQDIYSVIKDVVKSYQNIALIKKIDLKFEANGELLAFFDVDVISLVLRNLINNAIKYTNENGKIQIAVLESDQSIEIQVIDNGIGITPDTFADLFKDKVKISSKRGTAGETGTGLGLALCKKFAAKSNGSLSATSVVGEGSTFSLTLPKHGEK